MLELRARAGGLYLHSGPGDEGRRFHLKGVTWTGADGGDDIHGQTHAPPHGLLEWSIDDLLRKLAQHKFNTIRIAVNLLAMLRDEKMHLDDRLDIDREKNPWMAGTNDAHCPSARSIHSHPRDTLQEPTS